MFKDGSVKEGIKSGIFHFGVWNPAPRKWKKILKLDHLGAPIEKNVFSPLKSPENEKNFFGNKFLPLQLMSKKDFQVIVNRERKKKLKWKLTLTDVYKILYRALPKNLRRIFCGTR